MEKVFRKRINVFIAGPQTSAQGVERNFTPEDLQQVVESYDPSVHEAPLVIGHAGDHDGAPSYGWIKGFDRQGDKLYADVEFTDAAKDLVKQKHYKKVSISFYSPESPINPHKGRWSARHLALLGASPPAVKGLEPFSFSEGVFDFAISMSSEELFDKDLGPTLLVEKNPLELLKERLNEIKGDIKESLEDLKQSQEEQTESEVTDEETNTQADESAPENPNQQFSEMKKKMGREGAEVSESAQELEDAKTMKPDDQFEEGTSRKKAKGAHNQEVQVVQEVFEESEDSDYSEIDATIDELLNELDELDSSEEDFKEGVSHKKASGGKVSFGKHSEEEEDVAGRGETGKSSNDSYSNRQKVGKGENDGREDTSSDGGQQDKQRSKTSSNSEQETSRTKLAKARGGGDEESRWADQPEAKARVTDANQFGAGDEGLSVSAGVSDGNDPFGRDGGPTSIPTQYEEEPSDEEIAVPLESTKGNKKVRVLHQSSGDSRAATKGGAIADHAEGEADGLTSKPKKAGVSDGTDPLGRSGGPTEFPDRSEEEPDDLEMAVDLEDATESDAVRIIRQKSGDQPSVNHSERAKDPMSRTGKGSTYAKKSPEFEDEEEEDDDDMDELEDMDDFAELLAELDKLEELDELEGDDSDFSEETSDFCGMGSMGQAKSMSFPVEMYEELKALKQENDRLKREYEEHRINTRKAKIAEFIDSLYTEGKLTDGIIPQRELQNYCEGLEFGTLEFSEGETPTSKLFSMLNKLPNLVYFGEVVSNSPYNEPEEEEMDPHSRAIRMVESGEASDYVEAIKKCIPWGSN